MKSSTTRFVGAQEEIGKAKRFIETELATLGLAYEEQPFKIMRSGKEIPCTNIVAKLKTGTSSPTRKTIIVGAHYDSIPHSGPAPGADDNASGVVAALRVAKTVVSAFNAGKKMHYDVTFVFFSAEELGLLGSKHFVKKLVESGESANVYEVLTMDQVGFTRRKDNVANMIFETVGNKQGNQHIVDVMGRSALKLFGSHNTDLSVNYHGFGSDHIPFLDSGLPAVLFIERDNLYYAENFGHSRYDMIANINFDYAHKMAAVAANSVLALLAEG